MNQLIGDTILTVVSDSVFNNICDIRMHTFATAHNTELCWYDFHTLFVAVLALLTSLAAVYFAKETYKSQKQTEKYTSETQGNTQRISLESQKGLLVDLVRHLYRNLVVTYAIKTKLKHFGYDKYYPSEEHLLKLKVPVENLHLDAFYDNIDNYKTINKLYLLLRNYNVEIDVALNHFPQHGVDASIKEHDLDTLMFKPGFLVEKIMEFLCQLYPNEQDKMFREAYDIVCDAAKDNQSKRHGEAWPYEFSPYEDESSRFITKLFVHMSGSNAAYEFLQLFNADALIECGHNENESEKIYMIKYTNNK